MAGALAETKKLRLRQFGKDEIARAEVDDILPRRRLARQFIVRNQEIPVEFTGAPGCAS